MTNSELHRHTPTLQVYDPSGSPVRSVAYYRRCSSEQPQPRVTATATRRAGRVSQHWDPRLFALSATPSADTANLCGLTSLSGRPLLTDSVDAGWQLHLWGAAGELQLAWDGRGTRTRQTYDVLLRPIAVFEQRLDAPEHCIGLTTYGRQTPEALARNQCGQPVRVDDTAGCRQLHGYSLKGAPLIETRRFLRELTTPDWPPAIEDREALLEPQQATTHWRYDALGALRQQTDAQGNSQSTDYNVAGQTVGSRLLLKGQTEATTVLRDLGYNAWGQLTTETAGNGVTSTATYRPDTGVLQRLMAQRADHRCVQDLHYAYDPVGNVLSISDASQSIRYFANARIDPVTTYTYDSLSQLIEATGREVASSGHGPEVRVATDPSQLVNYTQRYAYDAAGNLHTLQHQGARRYTRQMQTAERSNRSLLQAAGGPVPEAQAFNAGFDANGNVQQLQLGQALHWDGRNQLCQVTPVVRESGAADSEHYVYDGTGQRLRKVRLSLAKEVRHISEVRYLPGLELREDSATGETLQVISLQSPGRSSVRVLHWVTGTPPGVRNNQLRYGVGDHLGSSTLELDREALLVSQEGYYPYGGTAWWAASQQSEVKYKTVRYSGKERDATGLYYYGFRYYAPGWGRWLNPDPAGTVDGLNLYRMVRNNPLSKKDDFGTESRSISRREYYMAKIKDYIPNKISSYFAPPGVNLRPGRRGSDGNYRPSNSFKIKKLSDENARLILSDFEKEYKRLESAFDEDSSDMSEESIDNVRIASHLAGNTLPNLYKGNKYALVDKHNTAYAFAQLTKNQAGRSIEVNVVMSHPYTQFSKHDKENERVSEITAGENKNYYIKGAGNVLTTLAIAKEIKNAGFRVKTITTNAINIRSQDLAHKLGASNDSASGVLAPSYNRNNRRGGFVLEPTVAPEDLNILDVNTGRLYI
ncbi:RHS repeat-associated core domain-containing protein [Pseudomonas sp. RT6P73]